MAPKAVATFAFLLLTTMFMLWAERRLPGRMQNRPGPSRAGPFGLLQPYADAIKLDIVPRRADKVLFWLAPAVPTITAWRSAGNSTPLCIVSGPHRRRARVGQQAVHRLRAATYATYAS